MIKEIVCKCCDGRGKQDIELCDNCGKEVSCGDYEGKRCCQNCWNETLTKEEINNL